jgi:hypothetical protein
MLSVWTSLYEAWCIYHGTRAHLNGLFHKSLLSFCVSVCVSPIVAKQLLGKKNPLLLLGNGSVKTLPRQRKHSEQWKNCWIHSFICGPCRLKEGRRLLLPVTSCFCSNVSNVQKSAAWKASMKIRNTSAIQSTCVCDSYHLGLQCWVNLATPAVDKKNRPWIRLL